MFRSVTFEVIGGQRLDCAACEQRVARLLKTVDGVGQVRAQAETQRIEVPFDAAVLQPRTIVERLIDAVYETKPVCRWLASRIFFSGVACSPARMGRENSLTLKSA